MAYFMFSAVVSLLLIGCFGFVGAIFMFWRKPNVKILALMGLSLSLALIAHFEHDYTRLWQWNVGYYLLFAAGLWFFARLIWRFVGFTRRLPE